MGADQDLCLRLQEESLLPYKEPIAFWIIYLLLDTCGEEHPLIPPVPGFSASLGILW